MSAILDHNHNNRRPNIKRYILLVGLLLCCFNARGNDDDESKIQTTWTTNFNNGSFAITIVNHDDHPIRVAHELTILFGIQGGDFHSAGTSVDDPTVFKPTIKFVAAPGRYYVVGGTYGSGQSGGIIEIAPGETKVVNFRPDDYFIQCANQATEAILDLTLDKTELKKYAMKKVDNLWKKEDSIGK